MTEWNTDMSAAPRDGSKVELEYDLQNLPDDFPRKIEAYWHGGHSRWVNWGRSFFAYSSVYKPIAFRIPSPPEESKGEVK